MNLAFSSEHQAFAESVMRALERACPLADVRAALSQPDWRFHKPVWDKLRDLGVLAAALPEAYGGADDAIALAAAAETVGATLAPAPLASALYLFGLTLLSEGDAESKSKWLPTLARGATIGACYFGSGLRVTNGRVTGSAQPVFDGLAAQALIVRANDGDATSLFLVSLDEGGSIDKRPLRTLDASKPAAEIVFADCPAIRLGSDDGVQRAKDRAATLLAFEQIGGAGAALAIARTYVSDRAVFGRAIGSYQSIKHALADVWVKLETARGHAYYALWAMNSNGDDFPLAAAAAHVSASDAFEMAARVCVHVHGGIGFTWEAAPQLYYRRARALSAFLGSTQAWRDDLGRRLIDGERPRR